MTRSKARQAGSRWCAVLALPFAVALSGCTATAWSEKVSIESTPMPGECGGWQKIDLKQRTTMMLLRADPKLVMEIDSHNLKGRNLGCWQ